MEKDDLYCERNNKQVLKNTKNRTGILKLASDLRTRHAAAQSTIQRLDSEQKRLMNLLAVSDDASEQTKNENGQLQNTIKDLTAKVETAVALARKHAAGGWRPTLTEHLTVHSRSLGFMMARPRRMHMMLLCLPSTPRR
ncbi:hypothetical protein EV421DRAFT_1033943 [Armillaria borealis]|uniref:Uncharacterized protein n=1 Tax=Armillaria borealis TaxID=47425 RepID=A0AA39JZ24_9AGAR|nr:hypothetical protein EV421DRAFT_1033943 [Armillaria borealis]